MQKLSFRTLVFLAGIFALASCAPNPQAPATTAAPAASAVTPAAAVGGTTACNKNRGKRQAPEAPPSGSPPSGEPPAGKPPGPPPSGAMPGPPPGMIVNNATTANSTVPRTKRQAPATTAPVTVSSAVLTTTACNRGKRQVSQVPTMTTVTGLPTAAKADTSEESKEKKGHTHPKGPKMHAGNNTTTTTVAPAQG